MVREYLVSFNMLEGNICSKPTPPLAAECWSTTGREDLERFLKPAAVTYWSASSWTYITRTRYRAQRQLSRGAHQQLSGGRPQVGGASSRRRYFMLPSKSQTLHVSARGYFS